MFVSHSFLSCTVMPSLWFNTPVWFPEEAQCFFHSRLFSYFCKASKEKEGETFHLQESKERVRVETQWESPGGKQ